MAVDGENQIAVSEASRYALRLGVRSERPQVALIERPTGAEMSVSKVFVVIDGPKVEVCEGEDRHECEKRVLETSRSLQHKRLAAW